MSDHGSKNAIFRVADLSPHVSQKFSFRPDMKACEKIAIDLDLSALRKFSFVGKILPDGLRDWRLQAKLGATVVQPCVITLNPVTTRIEIDVARFLVADISKVRPSGEEVEMNDDETIEPLGKEINVEIIMIEALALALPDYPRHPNARLEQSQFTPPGKEPINEEETRPFAGLAALRQKMGSKDAD